jgi:hypothetical protein
MWCNQAAVLSSNGPGKLEEHQVAAQGPTEPKAAATTRTSKRRTHDEMAIALFFGPVV